MTFLRSLAFNVSEAENPTRPLTDATLTDILGSGASATGISLSPEGALRIGTALRGVQITAGTVGALPLLGYRRDDRSRFRHTAVDGTHDDDPYTPFEKWETSVAHAMTRGNIYHYKTRDGRGNVLFTTPVHPARVAVDVVEDPRRPGVWDKVFTIDGKGPFTRYEILHIPMLSLDGIRGLGPIGYARETFNLAAANERAASLLFSQGMMQRGILTTDADLNEGKAAALKKSWREKMGGIDNAQDVAILDKGAKFQALTLSPADAQFLDSRKFSVTDIARLLGLPGWMLNDQEKSTSWGTGMEQQFTTWVKVTLQNTYLARIEQRYSKELLPKAAYCEFLLEGLLRGDSKARAAFYNAGITGGWLVPNDIRPKENMPPVAWGDEPYRPYNESAAAQQDDDSSTQEDDA